MSELLELGKMPAMPNMYCRSLLQKRKQGAADSSK